MDNQLLKELTLRSGVSGYEEAVAGYLCRALSPYADCRIDTLGSVIAEKKGNAPSHKKIMVTAPMDEAGFLLSRIQKDGYCAFECLGDMDPRHILGKPVTAVRTGLPGVVGAKAIHLQTAKERETPVPADKLYLDFGATSKEQLEKELRPGDSILFDGDFTLLGQHRAAGRGLEQKGPCAVLMELVKEESPADFTAVFTVQSLTTGAGMATAAYAIAPEALILLNSAPASDLPGASDGCSLAKGPVLPQMDRGVFYSVPLLRKAMETAGEKELPFQTLLESVSQPESTAAVRSQSGVPTLRMAIPCRYPCSPAAVVDLRDLDSTKALVQSLLSVL